MTTVLQLTKVLEQRPAEAAVPGVWVRNYRGKQDVLRWLEIRRQAFARQKLGVRDWAEQDFEREFLTKPWWDPARLWFAEAETAEGHRLAVGTIALAERGEGVQARPVVHWLTVVPSYRRRGIARLLLCHLEQACWDQGQRQIWLETHAAWTEAAHFYEQHGYRPA